MNVKGILIGGRDGQEYLLGFERILRRSGYQKRSSYHGLARPDRDLTVNLSRYGGLARPSLPALPPSVRL